MDTQGHKPQRPAPEDGKGVPPGWYVDPAGGWNLRWWDGARWTEHVAAAHHGSWRQSVSDPELAEPPRPPVDRRWTWSLSNVFQLELGIALLAGLISLLGMMGVAGCPAGSDRCYSLFGKAWLWLMGGQAVLVAVCSVAFYWSKSIAIKRAAVVLLPVGMVATWVVADRMITNAYNM
jgi:hypothetical protein